VTLTRRLVVTDVDSTLITGEVIEMIADHAGSRAHVERITERAMRGEIDFTTSLHERVATFAGLPVEVLGRVRDEVRLTPGATALVRRLQELGWPVGLVSGGFREVVGPIAADLGIGFVRANELEVEAGVLTGRVRGAVVDAQAKVDALRELARTEGIPMADTVAVGDGANDLQMLAAAGLGVAFNAKPVVREAADVCLDGRLDGLLELLGVGAAS
jgi:phosphoserine phosphatase